MIEVPFMLDVDSEVGVICRRLEDDTQMAAILSYILLINDDLMSIF